jgi:hypothetical protein
MTTGGVNVTFKIKGLWVHWLSPVSAKHAGEVTADHILQSLLTLPNMPRHGITDGRQEQSGSQPWYLPHNTCPSKKTSGKVFGQHIGLQLGREKRHWHRVPHGGGQWRHVVSALSYI